MRMSDQAPVADGQRNDRTRPGWFVSGIIAFAALMMMLMGSLHALSGFMALFEEDRYVVGSNGLLVHVDYSVYGVVHLVLGITMVMAGWGLFFRRTWARVVTVMVALVSAVFNWVFLPAYPAWYALMIGLDVLIIWAVVMRGDEGGWEEFE
jgi:hypothetical protein